MERLSRKFFLDHLKNVAAKLLGKYLLRVLPEGRVVSKIVETEAYGGFEDKACHVGRFGKTKRTETLFGEVGHAYIYPVHINTYCLNIVCHKRGDAGGILIRAVVPISGVDLIIKNLKKSSKLQQIKILNGPGKVCRGLKIDKTLNNTDMIEGNELYLLKGENVKKSQIVATPRINIPYAEESKEWLWRFILKEYY